MGPSRGRQWVCYSPESSCSGEGCNVSTNFVLVNLYRKRDRPDSWRSCSQPGKLIWKGGSEHTGVKERGAGARHPQAPLIPNTPSCWECWLLTTHSWIPCMAGPSAKENCFAQVLCVLPEATTLPMDHIRVKIPKSPASFETSFWLQNSCKNLVALRDVFQLQLSSSQLSSSYISTVPYSLTLLPLTLSKIFICKPFQ